MFSFLSKLTEPETVASFVVGFLTYAVVWLAAYGLFSLLGEQPNTLVDIIALSFGSFWIWQQWYKASKS